MRCVFVYIMLCVPHSPFVVSASLSVVPSCDSDESVVSDSCSFVAVDARVVAYNLLLVKRIHTWI